MSSRTLTRLFAGVATAGAALTVMSTVGAPAASAATTGSQAASVASRYAGVPYVWGGTSPRGFDCSGFTQYVFGRLGVHLPRTAESQYYAVTHVSQSSMRVGDLVFLKNSSGYVYHVGIYAGGGNWWVAPHSGTVVKLQRMYTSHYYVGRPSGVSGGSYSDAVHVASSVHRAVSSSHPLLQIGSRGAAVVELQHLLGISADGDFGPQTRAAVESFQRRHGLAADGVVGSHTWGAL